MARSSRVVLGPTGGMVGSPRARVLFMSHVRCDYVSMLLPRGCKLELALGRQEAYLGYLGIRYDQLEV